MSKMGAAVLECQEFAQENYNISKVEFVEKAKVEYVDRPYMVRWAVEEFNVIQEDLSVYHKIYG